MEKVSKHEAQKEGKQNNIHSVYDLSGHLICMQHSYLSLKVLLTDDGCYSTIVDYR